LPPKQYEAGKRDGPEPKTITARVVNHSDSSTSDKNLVLDCPTIQIQILGKKIKALVDTGSPFSFVGPDVIELIQANNLVTSPCWVPIKFLYGSYVCEECIELSVFYKSGVLSHKFFVVPGNMQTVLLGRDFIVATGIKIRSNPNEWQITPSEPTSKVENREKTSKCNFDLEENFDYTLGYANPAEVLSQWEFPDFMDECKESEHEVPLYPDMPDFLQVPSSLTENQREALQKVLYEFIPIFTKIPGKCANFEHKIDTGDHRPISTTLRPMNAAKRAIFDKTFDELLDLGIIEPSNSPWSSSGFVVPKKDGGYRFVIDYKPINKITVPDSYPIPRIDDILSLIGTSEYCSTFDLCKGFHQIMMSEEDKWKTCFISHRGSHHFVRMPMGLRNAPATFQRSIDEVLGDLKWRICAVFFDDLLGHSRTFEQHLIDLPKILSRIRDAGLTIHPRKVQLCRKKFKLLGFIIDHGQIKPDPDKVSKLQNYPVPRNVKDIQKFLGLIGFYRRFIDKFADLARPLTVLLSKSIKFCWSDEAQSSFERLRDALVEYTLLYLPDLNKPFIIQTDASDVGLGAILLQEIDNVRYPIWFASRVFQGAETRYSTSEKECLAVIYALDKFREFVEYSKFVIETDHQALSWLQRIKEPSGRLARWFMKLQMYDFEVKYRPGNSPHIRGADALSRVHESMFHVTNSDSTLSREGFIKEQESDPVLKEVIKCIKQNDVHISFAKKIVTLSKFASITPDGLLMRYVGPRGRPWEHESLYHRVWIPQSLRDRILNMFHTDLLAGHLGIRKTYSKLEDRVYWEGMRRDVVHFVKSCVRCQESMIPKIPHSLGTSSIPQFPWEIVSVDLMGPYPKGSLQSTHMLVLVDNFSK